jgi:hypothetical protein
MQFADFVDEKVKNFSLKVKSVIQINAQLHAESMHLDSTEEQERR